jgi:hypothetical protein
MGFSKEYNEEIEISKMFEKQRKNSEITKIKCFYLD